MEPARDTAERFSLDDLFSIASLAAAYPDKLTESTLRKQLSRRNENGLARCCIRQGRKLLISKTRYEQWLASRAGV
jgi:hypothetical protein